MPQLLVFYRLVAFSSLVFSLQSLVFSLQSSTACFVGYQILFPLTTFNHKIIDLSSPLWYILWRYVSNSSLHLCDWWWGGLPFRRECVGLGSSRVDGACSVVVAGGAVGWRGTICSYRGMVLSPA